MKRPEVDDREYVARSLQGDDRAFAVLVQRYQRGLYNLACGAVDQAMIECFQANSDVLVSCQVKYPCLLIHLARISMPVVGMFVIENKAQR